jgi:hypothetical protein
MHIQTRLPRVGAAFSAGDLDRRRVGVLIFETIHLSIAEARKIADRLLPDAPSMTTGRLRAAIRRLCLEADPGDSAARYEAATDERRVVVQASPNGTADLVGLDLPPDRVAEIRDRIEMIARDLRRTGETRTMDQLRADVYLDLLSGTVASAKGALFPVMTTRVNATSLRERLVKRQRRERKRKSGAIGALVSSS